MDCSACCVVLASCTCVGAACHKYHALVAVIDPTAVKQRALAVQCDNARRLVDEGPEVGLVKKLLRRHQRVGEIQHG